MLGNWSSACDYGGLTYLVNLFCEVACLKMVWFVEMKTSDVFEIVVSIIDIRGLFVMNFWPLKSFFSTLLLQVVFYPTRIGLLKRRSL